MPHYNLLNSPSPVSKNIIYLLITASAIPIDVVTRIPIHILYSLTVIINLRHMHERGYSIASYIGKITMMHGGYSGISFLRGMHKGLSWWVL